jgi:hypothetical protein
MMTSTTVEKAIFIIFGLAIFSAIGIPIFNAIQEIVEVDAVTRDFDSMVSKIDLGLRVVEHNGSSVYSSPVNFMADMTVVLTADSWGIKVEYTGAQVHLVKSIYSQTCPITLACDNEEGTCQLFIEKINGFIVVRFLKEGM